jgi:hypothetical protein
MTEQPQPQETAHPILPPERAMTMSEPPSYNATVAATAAPHSHANAMEQGLADITPLDHLQAVPAMIVCPYCNHRGMTRVDKRNTGAA